MLRILRSVTVLKKITFIVTLSRKYRIPVYLLPPQIKCMPHPPTANHYHIMSQSGVFIMI